MDILIYLTVLVISFVALIKGADFFVDGACGIARILKVPGLIIGLTVVSMGTSLPELAVSVTASVEGSNEIAISNVLGSNIFNILMVLGVCALIRPVPIDRNVIKRDFPLTIILSIVLAAILCIPRIPDILNADSMNADVSEVGRLTGVLLLITFIIYLIALGIQGMKSARSETGEEEPKPDGAAHIGKIPPAAKYIALIIIGCALIIAGGKGAVWSAKLIAAMFGMSETLIGLTVVAIGTSLPELITSMVASRKGEAGLAVGNAVGSSIFNMLFILGTAAAISPVSVNLASVYDLAVFIFITVITMYFCHSRESISKKEGIIMICLYLADMAFAIIR